MPDTEDLERAKGLAKSRLGGTALGGAAGAARQEANNAVTALYIELYATLDALYLFDGRDKSLALTKLEESKMWAIKSIFSDTSADFLRKKTDDA